MKKLCAGALLLSVNLAAWGATCETSATHLGTLWPSNPVAFGASCAADRDADPTDASTWSFTHTFTFTLAAAANVFSTIDLHRTQGRMPYPDTTDPYFMITTDDISFLHNGVTSWVGGEGAGQNEKAAIVAHGIEAGDYTMTIYGRVFDYGSRAGWYTGDLNVSYLDPSIAAPVPEPETLALLMLGLPVVAWAARRRQQGRAAS
jgi:hypothetical protein